MRKLNLVGNVYGRLTVVSESDKKIGVDKRVGFLCICECGEEIVTTSKRLIDGATKSCGCLQKERCRKHGMSGTNEYWIYKGMVQRCCNKKCKYYKIYGAKGIKVDDRWLGPMGFSNFIKDMGPKPSKNHSLDRFPNNKGGYGPDNCRWATKAEQMSNIKTNVWIEYKGRKMILSEWARLLGLNSSDLSQRLKSNNMEVLVERYLTRRSVIERCVAFSL